MANAAETLRQHDLRPTAAREWVLGLLTEHTADGGSITPEALHRRLAEQGHRSSLPSVYRVLVELTDAGLVERFRPAPGASVFALKRGAHVLHLLCTRCRSVEVVRDARAASRLRAVGEARGFALERVGWSLLGLCKGCSPP
ncbi:Fur family transcriptional regulator [Piscinibacter gummiphilus]|uniref:Uncharacterized protein n=1 Tax=Piscinibacter gummiphilus TaxID=946333 RepID=A0A1W6LDZ5_9BURK|nr:transcriptional repressor [Piscinibacter gummiphilus]ARN22482.1 hypothetical protein A4W93_22655 [Piscinibacter gummiphilus]ATU67176.1 transcriptional repressor [Piscinibacter gummiphilus]GLS98067.1 hypothetical protein GCM10007918_53590 [Piscinibacter gummiphilus]